MKILIDINHPAHVHYFRNFYKLMIIRGHEILIVSRNKEVEHQLLELYEIPFIDRGRGKEGFIGKMVYMIQADLTLLSIATKFKPDLFLNFLHPYPSHIAFLLGKPSIVFSDTEHASLHHKLTLPFTTKLYTPACYRLDLGKKHFRFNGFMELCYLHPNYFIPDPTVLDYLEIAPDEKYVIVRFVSWQAAHDFGHSGISMENKRKAIEEFSQYAKVFISSEMALPEDLEKYRIKIPVNKMHDAIYYASLLFGESATMASEAAVLGTPAIFLDNNGRGYTDEEERKYQMVNNYSESPEDQLLAIEKAIELLTQKTKADYLSIREELLSDCIDPTELMMNVVEEYSLKEVHLV